jgi:hypothetical protein
VTEKQHTIHEAAEQPVVAIEEHAGQVMPQGEMDADAWLAANDSTDPDDVIEPPQPSVLLRDPVEEDQPEPEPAAETPSEEVQEEPAETPQADEGVDPEELETAIKALRLSGMPQTAFDNLSQAEIVSYGLKQAQRNKDVDAKLREAAETREKLEALEAAARDENATDDGERRAPTPEADISEVVESLSDQLGYGNDAQVKEALTKFGHALSGTFQTVVDGLREQNQALRDQVAQVQGTAVEDRLAQARAELTERYPQLSDGKVWDAVVQRGERLARGGGYEGPSRFSALVGDAAMLELGAPQSKPDLSARNGSRDNGQPKPPTTKPVPESMSRDQRDSEILSILEAGGSDRLAEARRIAGTA